MSNPFEHTSGAAYFSQEHDELKKRSRVALENMYEFAVFRVGQLEYQLGIIKYFMNDVGELEDMYRLAERSERVQKNRIKFEKLKEALEYELFRRSFEGS